MWYAIQVVTGREDMVVTSVNKLVRKDLFSIQPIRCRSASKASGKP